MSSEFVEQRAVDFVVKHFRAINRGDAVAVRDQLFQPDGVSEVPRARYVESIIAMRPFTIESVRSDGYKPPRQKGRHGVFGTVRVRVTVRVGGLDDRRCQTLPVWWSASSDRFLMGARMTHWVSDWRRARESSRD